MLNKKILHRTQRLFQNFLFKLLFLLISLHTFIPHPHADELFSHDHHKIHTNSNTLIGFIKYIFHESDDNVLDRIIFINPALNGKDFIKRKEPSFGKIPTFYVCKKSEPGILSGNLYGKPVFIEKIFPNLNGMRAPPHNFFSGNI